MNNMVINQRLINEVSVGIVFVQGPNTELQMTAGERIAIAAQVQSGLSWMATLNSDAKVSWVYDYKTISLNQQAWPNAPWKGLPREFYQKRIDAALWRESNKKTYMFYKDQYVRLSGSTVNSGYPKPIAGNWKGLPAEFEEGIDAAFWHKTKDKIYMFKGDQYVRLTETVMDDNYPKPIAGNWKDLPAEFEDGIDAVFMHHGTNKLYMFKGSKYARLTNTTMDNGYPKNIKGNFKGLPEYMEDGIKSALWRGDNNKVYFFSNPSRTTLTSYVRFSDITKTMDANYPKFVGGLDKKEAEALWRDPAQAELGVGPGKDGYKQYVENLREQYNTDWGIVAFITKYPTGWFAYARTPRIVMSWSDSDNFGRVFAHETGHTFGAPDEYASSNCNCSSISGRFFTAKNGNCKLCTTSITMESNYPRPITGNWKALPSSFTSGIDAAVWRNSNNKAYFFKGDQYARISNTTMDDDYPKSIQGNWSGLPSSFDNGIDAALWRPKNDKLYFFKGSQYVRLTGSKMDDNYPKSISGNWKDLPANFNAGIDAAIWRESNDKIYLFKGSQYVRLTDTKMDSGYPKPIAGHWKGLPSTFTNGVTAALMHRDKEAIYLFDGNDYARMSNGVPCLMASNSDQLCSYTPLHFGWGAFEKKIDAAVWRLDNNKAYLFSGGWYARYTDIDKGMDEGFPKKISKRWKRLPTSFKKGIDAALYHDTKDKLYMIKGSEYIRLTGSTVDENYPRPIAGNWKGLPASFNQGIDAALWREGNGKIYFFKGNQYVRLTGTKMDAGYPKAITGNWKGLPSHFSNGIDAALMRRDNGKIYFFNGRTYVRYTKVSDGIDAAYPAWIDKRWMPFPT
ncbi:MAG: hypothetical protein JKX81_04805 [Arenicella sp.]|nr:hypothetical protein [Arenicella sp.]